MVKQSYCVHGKPIYDLDKDGRIKGITRCPDCRKNALGAMDLNKVLDFYGGEVGQYIPELKNTKHSL